MNVPSKILIHSAVTKNGFEILLGNKPFAFSYPDNIWHTFPESLKKPIADTAAVFSTRHLGYAKQRTLTYLFPPPASYPLFFQGYLYSIAGSPLEFPKNKWSITNLLRDAYNSEFRIKFTGLPYETKLFNPGKTTKNTVMSAFSFGKDSLLTWAILRKFGYHITPLYFQEPSARAEIAAKMKLRHDFEKQFSQPILTFPMTLGTLRDAGGDMWGWDLLLLQYTLLLLPFLYAGNHEYFCWSNEQSLTGSVMTKEGYEVNPSFDQTAYFTALSNTMLRTFGINSLMTSVVEPLYEMVMLSILHHTFADVGRYQLSCDLPEKPHQDHRWCGSCHECARQYILMLGAGVDPARVGLKTDMLSAGKINLHHFFNHFEEVGGVNSQFQSETERKLALYIACKRGVKGDLIKIFKRRFYRDVEKNKKALFSKYFSLRSTDGMPPELKNTLLPFYKKEIERIRKDVMSDHPAPVGKFS